MEEVQSTSETRSTEPIPPESKPTDVLTDPTSENDDTTDKAAEKSIEGIDNEKNDNSKETDETSAAKSTDEYAYLNREGFTSEIFKIELKNVNRNVTPGQMKKFLVARNLKPRKVKLMQLEYENKAYASFSCDEERDEAINVLNGYKWRGRELQVKRAAPKADPLQMKRRHDGEPESNEPEGKRAKSADDDLDPDEKLKNSVTPWWKIPYPEQIEKKLEITKEVLRKLGKSIDKNNTDLVKWFIGQKKANDGMCCELEPVIASPITEGYRNKCEFTIGRSLDRKERVVGFRYGKYRGGSSSVGPVDCCTNMVPTRSLKIVKHFQSYIAESEHDVFEPEHNTGHWRMLTVRTNVTGQTMAMVEFHPQKLNENEIEAVKTSLKTYFTEHASNDVTSLYFHINSERTTAANDVTPYELILGEPHLIETLSDLQFRISPLAFFQVNTPAAELLYARVGELCQAGPETTVLDVCCGTGTIGLTMAKRVKKVVGIEMIQAAIDDAKINAKLNNLENTEYRCGKAEEVLPDLMNRLDTQNLVAVLDPPRAGLHIKVIQALRRCHELKRLVYVSCNPNAAMNNFVDLCRAESKRIRGPPFVPVKATCVDLFPDTAHYELVILFERYDPALHMAQKST